MKILFVNNQFRLGGAETVVRQLVRGFPEAQLAVADGKTFPPGVQTLYPRPLARLHHTRLHGLVERFAPRDRWTDRNFRCLADGPHDLIHLHNFHGRYATMGSLAYVARRKPLVWTFHALWGVTGGCDHPRECRRYVESCGHCPQLNRWPIGPVDDTAAQLDSKFTLLADLPLHIIAPSRWLADVVRASRVGRKWHIHHVPNAVDAEFVESLPDAGDERQETASPTVLVVNRNFRDEQKGFPIICDALSLIPPLLRTRLLLVGENADWAAGQLPNWNSEPIGYVAQPAMLAKLHARANVFLFASPAENFPCAVLEAMAAGSCVVATPTGGVTEQVDDGVSGLLAREISSPALAAVLTPALSDSPLRARLGMAASKRVLREFSEPQLIERHCAIYAETLNSWQR